MLNLGKQHSILEAGSGRRLPNLTVPRPLYATPFEDARGQATVDGIFFPPPAVPKILVNTEVKGL